MKNQVVEILIERDGMSRAEAEKTVREYKDRMAEADDPEEEFEEILSELGLEPDYIFDLLH